MLWPLADFVRSLVEKGGTLLTKVQSKHSSAHQICFVKNRKVEQATAAASTFGACSWLQSIYLQKSHDKLSSC